MWLFYKKSKSDIIRNRIVSSERSDIFVQPPKYECAGYIDIRNQTFTEEFAEYCKQYYSKFIRPDKQYYIQFSFMCPPCGRTYESDTRIEIVDYSVCWGNCDFGYIQSPMNNLEYIPMKQVFRILKGLMDETNRPYVVNVNTIKFNVEEWEQDNMLLTFMFVQK